VSHQQQQGKVPSAQQQGKLGLISCNSREGLQQQGRSATAGKVCNSREGLQQQGRSATAGKVCNSREGPQQQGKVSSAYNSKGRSCQLQQQGKVTSAATAGEGYVSCKRGKAHQGKVSSAAIAGEGLLAATAVSCNSWGRLVTEEGLSAAITGEGISHHRL
jgi:hypothetical protein